MKLSQKTKGICSLISMIINGLLIGNLFTFSNLSIYNEQYLKNNGNLNLEKDDIYIFNFNWIIYF